MWVALEYEATSIGDDYYGDWIKGKINTNEAGEKDHGIIIE